MLLVTGYRSAIVRTLIPTLPEGEKTERADAGWRDFPVHAERYLFCAGLLRPRATAHQCDAEMAETFNINCGQVIRACDQVLAANGSARICVVGSESGYSWSFDGAYAAAKAGLHRYVEARPTRHGQQLVAVAPSIIEDCRMTTSRTDQDALSVRAARHSKGRFLKAAEVAGVIRWLLYDCSDYATGFVFRMHGGQA